MTPRCLAINLFYNDDDIVEDALTHLLENNHELVVWDHGSDDGTAAVLDRFAPHIRERHYLPRSFDFYKLFEHVSRHVMEHLADQYDWISFPESDEFLEGPDRTRSYYHHVCEVVGSEWDFLQFRNNVFWFTDADDPAILSPRRRIKHYSVWPDCPPRVYGFRARCLNVRWFGHNDAKGKRHPVLFNTCHYPVRSLSHMDKRERGRIGLSRGGENAHFDAMVRNRDRMIIPPEILHYDDGGELSKVPAIDWKTIYR